MTEKMEAALEADTEALSDEERTYFESGGEQDIAPVEEVAAEAEAPDEGEPSKEQARDEKGKFVPHQALHAEREEHKKTRSELQELKEFRARMEERMQWFEKAQKPEEKQEDAPPDPNEDIFAYTQWQAKQLEKLNSKLSEREQQEQQFVQHQQEERQVWGYWEADARRYAQENPDFGNAAKWLSETRDKQLQAFAAVDERFADPRARNAQIEAELKQIVVAAAQQGKSAAEAVYQIAGSYGYAPQSEDKGGDEIAEKLDRLERAQAASKTVGQASGRSGGDELSAESIASMSEDDFSRWVSVPENARRFEKLMGG